MNLHAHLLNFLFPVTCAGCGRDLSADDYYRICPDCFGKIRRIEGLVCVSCGIPLPDGGAHCWSCRRPGKRHFHAIRSFGTYDGLLRDCILRFKFNNRRYLERILGRFAVETYRRYFAGENFDMVVPVPLHWTRLVMRGYNQADLIARQLCRSEGLALNAHILSRRRTRHQSRLNRADRNENLRGKFTASAGAKGKRILLIDDVCTTAATIEACAAALAAAGARAVSAVTVARD